MSQIIKNFINNINSTKPEPLIICGRGGSGKSYLIRQIQNKVNKINIINNDYDIDWSKTNVTEFINNIHNPAIIIMATENMDNSTKDFIRNYSNCVNLDTYPKFSVTLD